MPLVLLLELLSLKPNSYYYARWASKQPDKYKEIRPVIHEISQMSSQTYGSPRIWLTLRRRNIFISEKAVRKTRRQFRTKRILALLPSIQIEVGITVAVDG